MSAARALMAFGAVVFLNSANLPANAAAICSIQSSPHRVALLELYTSEGCNSCPPADRWLSALPQQGVTPDRAVLLAFHVDYWNELGWPDRFSQARFSERQRTIAAHSRSAVIYTPQIVLDGHDLRAGTRPERLSTTLGEINAQAAPASLRADLVREGDTLRIVGQVQVHDASARADAQVWVAILESGLSSKVTAGENGGKLLQHDFVVRDLSGPFTVAADGSGRIDHSIPWGPGWNAERTGIALFVQRRDGGEVIQAATLARVCGS